MTIVIPGIFEKTLTVFRRLPGSYVNGRWNKGVESSFTIKASSQPLTLSERGSLEDLLQPDGFRSRQGRKLYTSSTLQVSSKPNQKDADEVDINGVRFEVKKILDNRTGNSAHMKVLLLEVNK